MIDLNQLWADEMNGKVKLGTYRKAYNEFYKVSPDGFTAMELNEDITTLKEINKELLGSLKAVLYGLRSERSSWKDDWNEEVDNALKIIAKAKKEG